MRVIKILLFFVLLSSGAAAKDYNASLFGILSDGVTNNTGSIQKAIDFIHENGGGRLVFYVGRYVTGGVQLKSGVHIKLEEGAVIVGAASVYDYNSSGTIKAIIGADGQKNIGISGKGVIEGNGPVVMAGLAMLEKNGYLKSQKGERPALLGFTNCSDIRIDSVNLWNGCGRAQVFDGCSNVVVEHVNISSRQVPGAGGIRLKGSSGILIKDSFIDVPQRPAIEATQNKELRIERTIDPEGKSIKPGSGKM
ncbi:glycosyl hydrolase family 28 protein [Niabella beijingensis]|uniref:glycosyl hydrolase family 28 protein n=1 Tax=Niabella beijingensis TaxID=2872700 RepID=UPI001CBB9C97|nr:glycosyl hydrolase family 28 protein [Niabella beijingensis]MBZ4189511.1 endopygalactorunase [Niabella beijingensis]